MRKIIKYLPFLCLFIILFFISSCSNNEFYVVPNDYMVTYNDEENKFNQTTILIYSKNENFDFSSLIFESDDQNYEILSYEVGQKQIGNYFRYVGVSLDIKCGDNYVMKSIKIGKKKTKSYDIGHIRYVTSTNIKNNNVSVEDGFFMLGSGTITVNSKVNIKQFVVNTYNDETLNYKILDDENNEISSFSSNTNYNVKFDLDLKYSKYYYASFSIYLSLEDGTEFLRVFKIMSNEASAMGTIISDLINS